MRYHKFYSDDVFCALLPEVKARKKVSRRRCCGPLLESL